MDVSGKRPGRRILVLSAAVGEGHESAARALASELAFEAPDAEVVVRDVLPYVGPFLRWVLRDLYRLQLRFAPWSYACVYWLVTRVGVARVFGRAMLVLLARRRLRRLIAKYDPDVVVSTYPAVTSVLGHERRKGRLRMPVCATISDLAGLAYWAHPGIDLHLVMHEQCVEEVERIAGSGRVKVVRPLVAAAFLDPPTPTNAREWLGLPKTGRLVVVSGGGWGVGDLAGAVEGALALAGTLVVAVAGRNEETRRRLEARFAPSERVVVLGFTDRLPLLLAAADAVVHTTGGVTCLEAIACGCPLVTYGEPPGHPRTNDRFLRTHGLAVGASDRSELTAVLASVLERGRAQRPSLVSAPSAGAFVGSVPAHVEPLPQRAKVRLARAALALAATLPLVGWTFASSESYEALARPLDLQPLTAVHVRAREVALVVRCPASFVPAVAAELRARRAQASFALAPLPAARTRELLAAAGDEPLPLLARTRGARWLADRTALRREARVLGLERHFYYLPESPLSLAQYLLLRSAGALPVMGSAQARPGSVVVLALAHGRAAAGQSLDRLLAMLSRRGLDPVPLSVLLADASSRASGGERSRTTAPATTSASEPTSAAPMRSEPQSSPATSGASATGTRVSVAKTVGAT